MKIIILAENNDSTSELDRARASFRGEGFGEPEIYSMYLDNERRMNLKQVINLWRLCGRYGVSFREDDYHVIPAESTFMPGYVEGWVGGARTEKTIFVGVDPEGRVNS